jgi:hypothetical protein
MGDSAEGDFTVLRRTYGVARALNEFYERYHCLPSDFGESDAACEARGLRGLLPAVENLLHHCS